MKKNLKKSLSGISVPERIQRITHLIDSFDNFDEILLHIKDPIVSLFDAERMTIFFIDETNGEVFSKIKTGAAPNEIRVIVNKQSIVGYVASTGACLSINNAYDQNELKAIYPDLNFDKSWDKRSKYHTKQILAYPLMYQNSLFGVIQIINKKSSEQITHLDRANLHKISRLIAQAFYVNSKMMNKYKSKFDYLISKYIISQSDLNKALAEARKRKCDIADVLIEDYKINKSLICKSFSVYFKVKYLEYDNSYTPPEELLSYIKMKNPIKFMRHNGWVPYKKENERILIVCDDPTNERKISEIQLVLGDTQFDFMVGLRRDIVRLIDKLTAQPIINKLTVQPKKSFNHVESELKVTKENSFQEEIKEIDENDSLIARHVNQIITQACSKGASDIHVETCPGKQNTIIRLREDGDCYLYKEIPANWKKAFVSRIKIMANLNIAERRLPQDGKIQLSIKGKKIELRVATIPTHGGNEDVVMRILADQEPIPLDKLNLSPWNYQLFLDSVNKPHGIFLVVGPTGSGKTTTLHSALNHINKPELKIWTAEDPVEITQKGLRQVQINPNIDLTFSTALRAFLRADPDVIMIGEMRDHETANICIGASLTGHFVFSTLHTNSAAETITRLIDLGIDTLNVGDALQGVLAQRLTKTLCPFCKENYRPSKSEIDELGSQYGEKFMPELQETFESNSMCKPRGCPRCDNSGFKGRTGIHEILVVNQEIKKLIQKKAPAEQIRESAIKNGMRTLKQDGIWKVLKGDTTFDRIRAVCSV